MNIAKAQWTTEGNNVRLMMPLSKVDVEKRIVSGFASLDNPDSQGDVILKEANQKAFARFRGNIREMHQPIAVGRMVSFKEDSFYDTATEKFYNGIWVDVYVSKGAQSTWEKVLDGTLQGFSIGGAIIDSEVQFVKDSNSPVRFVKDYELVELSLVDSPANQLANIFSITKSASGETQVSGLIADVATENVFHCGKCEIAKTSSDESMSCPEGHAMVNIGWFEYDGGDRTEKVRALIDEYLSPNNNEQDVPANNEGGVDVAENEVTTPEPGEAVPAEVGVAEQGKAQTEVNSSTEEAADVEEVSGDSEAAANVSEVDDAENDLAKMFDDLSAKIEAGLEKNAADVEEALTKVESKMTEFTKSFESKIESLEEKSNELTEKVLSLNEELGKMEKSMQALEAETAIKKSGDLGGSTEGELKKSSSVWGNHFLSVDSL